MAATLDQRNKGLGSLVSYLAMCAYRHGLFALSRVVARKMPILSSGQAQSAPLPVLIGKRWIQDKLNAADANSFDARTGQPRKVRLLVDADGFGVDQILHAMACLAEKFDDVNALIFAAPGILKAKKKRMNELVQRSDVQFVPVPRGDNQVIEPNDDAIVAKMQTLASSRRGECIALLTSDKGFAQIINQLMSDKQQSFLVLVPSFRVVVADFYRQKGIPVFALPFDGRCPKIRAILDVHGNGTVEFGEAFEESACRDECQVMYSSWENLLKAQGCSAAFSSSEGYPIQRMTKFWFANGLGYLLPVFPAALAAFALDRVIRQEPRTWLSDTQSLAYVLPVSSLPAPTKSILATYGSRRSCSVHRGGGPFMLKDSDDLVAQALRKLGYLDDYWNTDLTEALNCFWNATLNKHKLRKLDMLIDPLEASSAAAKLRIALLSDMNDGLWQRGGTCTSDAVNILRSEGLLPEGSEAPAMDDIWCALKTYTRVHRLSDMKTLNALAAHVVAHNKRHDPHRRGKIVIARGTTTTSAG